MNASIENTLNNTIQVLKCAEDMILKNPHNANDNDEDYTSNRIMALFHITAAIKYIDMMKFFA